MSISLISYTARLEIIAVYSGAIFLVYPILSSSIKKGALEIIKAQIGDVEFQKKEYISHMRCPVCKTHEMQIVFCFNNRGPPKNIKERLKSLKNTQT